MLLARHLSDETEGHQDEDDPRFIRHATSPQQVQSGFDA